jgi:hypothetical protein
MKKFIVPRHYHKGAILPKPITPICPFVYLHCGVQNQLPRRPALTAVFALTDGGFFAFTGNLFGHRLDLGHIALERIGQNRLACL